MKGSMKVECFYNLIYLFEYFYLPIYIIFIYFWQPIHGYFKNLKLFEKNKSTKKKVLLLYVRKIKINKSIKKILLLQVRNNLVK